MVAIYTDTCYVYIKLKKIHNKLCTYARL